jgi:hypothetical protein
MFDFINRPLVSCIVCNKAVYTNNTTCSLECRKAELLHDLYIDQQVTAGLEEMYAFEKQCELEEHLDGT